MDVLTAIKTRRSVRKYENKIIPEGHVKKILEAAMSGPTAVNQMPWQFIVINEPQLLKEIPKVHPNGQMVADAALAILVCADEKLLKFPDFWVQDCSIASQNILLAAHSLGLGAVWTGVYPLEDRVLGIKEVLGLPKNIWPLSLIPIGYPGEKPAPRELYDESRVHYNKF
ncbi:MAG: nitroreductase family protein [Methanobacterium sp.]|nr:nitroreductase family protein [Methanobacterium sp.]